MCCGGRGDLGATDQTERSDGVAICVSWVAGLFYVSHSRGRAQEKAFGERTRRLGTTNSARKSLFHLIFLCALFHFALTHLDRHDVNFVLRGILMGFERYLMSFMAFQGLWVGHRPALVVLVDERFSVSANFA